MGLVVLAGVIAAAALKCMGGHIQGRLWPRDENEKKRALEAGYDLTKVTLFHFLLRGYSNVMTQSLLSVSKSAAHSHLDSAIL